MKGIWKLLAIACLTLTCAGQAVADDAKDHGQGDAQAKEQAGQADAGKGDSTMETVVVTASRVEEKMKTVTQSITVIPREELDKNQYHDLGDMLKNYGVDVMGGGATANGSFSSISIRGLSTPRSSASFGNDNTSYVLILIDGRRTVTSNVSMIPMMGIERVEILRGPGALQYGAQAMGGVVNIITKKGGKELKIAAEAGYGSWETVKGMGSISGMIGPVDFAGAVSGMQQGADYRTGNSRTYGNTKVQNNTSYLLNLGVNFLDEHRLGVSFVGSERNNMGLPYYPKHMGQHTSRPFTDRSEYSFDIKYDGGYKNAGLNWYARYFKGFARYEADSNNEYTKFPTGNYWDTEYFNRYEIDTQGAQGQVSWDSTYLTLTGGIDWYNYDYRPDHFMAEAWDTPAYNMESDNIGAFILAKVKLFDDKLILNGGLRYDDFTQKYQGKNNKVDHTSYSIGARWNALDWLHFKANYGTSFRMPDPQQIAGYKYGYTTQLSNTNLKPEKGFGWDVGFGINYKSARLDFTYFENRITDKIITDYDQYPQKAVNLNGTSLYRGIEGQASIDIAEFFDWPFQLRPYVNFTHLFQYEDGKGEIIRHVRNLELAYGLNFNYPKVGLTADLRFIYLGHKMEADPVHSDYSVYPYKIASDRRTGGDTTMDFYITKTIWDWEEGGKLSIKGAITNIMNVNYSTQYGYPNPGRAFYVGLRYDF